MKLLVATGNQNKLKEFARILTPLGIETQSPAQLGISAEIEETGATFAENAKIKAEALYRLTGMPTVADDSGLCVDALDGRPGVFSARYLGDAPQSEKNASLIKEIENVPDEKRTAQFVCSICCVMDSNTVITSDGCCEGIIAHEPSGSGGFGYDPIFLLDGISFASLDGEKKDKYSHRGKALRQLAEKLEAHIKQT